MKRTKMKRHIVNCQRHEANQARYTAFFATQRVLRMRRLMWADLQLRLFEQWLWAHRKGVVLLIVEIIGSLYAVWGICKLSVLWGQLMR